MYVAEPIASAKRRMSPRRGPVGIVLVCVAASLAACGGSSLGEAPNPAPKALITAIGIHPASGEGTSSVSMTVRSGSAVILSGKDSDGLGVALAGFHWQQTGGPSLPAPPDVGAMLYQTANTVSFTAPQVATDTTLTFQLTVANTKGVASNATAKVTVTAANDPSEFLMPAVVDNATRGGAPPRRLVVAVAPSQNLTGLPADQPVCVRIARQLSYTSRDSTVHDGVANPMLSLPQLTSLQAQVAFRQATGATGTGSTSVSAVDAALQASTSPRVTFDVPAFNDLELDGMFAQPTFDARGNSLGAPAALVNQQLVAADLDTAVLHLTISATPGSCDGMTPATALATVPLAVGVYAPGAAAPAITNVSSSGYGTIDVKADDLAVAVNPSGAEPVETLASAQAYYAAADPPWAGAPKTDLGTWLTDNCFDPSASDYGVGAAGANGAHATYTNNFDLGFGRDMYVIRCAADHQDAAGNVTAHAGDLAAVVLNYASLEQAALKVQPIIAVAMEYQGEGHTNGNCASTDPAINKCIVKFYVFAPDDRTGAFKRVGSANFDRRGNKYVPGTCVSCHGGAVADTTFATTANVDASFMPWDLGALLYADTDPSFLGNQISPAAYTRAAQEPSITQLNALVWQTYQTPEMELPAGGSCTATPQACVDRLAAPVALLTKWYGWCNTTGSMDPRACATAHAFDDSADPSSGDWPTATPAGAPTTASGAPNDLYHAAYAHYCRSCHTQNNVVAKQFNDFNTFAGYFRGAQGSAANGIPALIYNDARMPLARLTLDRFWVAFDGSASAGQRLADFINDPANSASVSIPVGAGPDAAGNTVAAPGAPVLTARVYKDVDSASGPVLVSEVSGQYTVDRFSGARVDLSSSLFTDVLQSTFSQAPSPVIVGDNTASPTFDTSAAGHYLLQVTAASAAGKSMSNAPFTYTLNVASTPPVISASCQSLSTSGTVGTAADISLMNCITPGTEPANAGYNALQIQQVPGGNCQNATTSGWVGGPTALTDASGTWTAAVSTMETYGVSLTFASSATANESVTICFRVTDVDGNDPVGAITFALSDTLHATAPAGALPLTPPATSYSIAAVTLTASDSIAPPSDTAVTLVLSAGTTVLGGAIGPSSIGLSGHFTYTPPSVTFLTCDINGHDIVSGASPCTYDIFSYHLLSGDGKTQSNTATVNLNVQATTSFNRTGTSNDIYQSLSVCASCHVTGGVVPAPSEWLYEGGAGTTYNSVTGVTPDSPSGIDWTTHNFSGGAVGYSSSAALYDNPCNSSTSHYQTEYPGSASAPQPAFCSRLLQWILEGAHND